MLQMLDRFENAFVLADDMRGAPFHNGGHFCAGKLLARGVAKGRNTEYPRGFEALVAPFIVFAAGKGVLDARVNDEQTHARRKRNVFDGLGTAIQKDGMLPLAENRGHLIEQAATYPDEFVFCLAAQPGKIEWRHLKIKKPRQ